MEIFSQQYRISIFYIPILIYKKNDGYKTANINGILYLVNDGCEEFLYHYENKIKFDPKKLRNLLITENKKYNNYFLIVPDKVVYTHDIHSKHLTKKEGPLVI